MAQPEFTAPDFLDNTEPDDIQKRMMDNLPEDISDMEGDFPYDFTKPTAIELSQVLNDDFIRVLMICWPEYAWDEWLDLHGAMAGLTRHAAITATGSIEVVAEGGTVIPAGEIFSVPETDSADEIEFETTEEVEFVGDEDTEVTMTIPIQAVEAGANGNVIAGSITAMDDEYDGIVSVTNPTATSGGIDEESDDDFYDRIKAANESGNSFVGNDTDFINWAKAVDGVGDCIVEAAWNGPGTIRLIIVDANGDPASQDILDAVYDYIVSPNDASARLLPAGAAQLTVVAATAYTVNFTCTGLELTDTTLATVTAAFEEGVQDVYSEAKSDNILRYNSLRRVLSNIDGVTDFDTFEVNNGTANITLSSAEYAVTGTITFTEE